VTDSDARLPHGYTNATRRLDGVIHKAYQGPDADLRHRVERAALSALRGRFPVPEVLRGPDGELCVAEVPGRPGQEALDGGHAAAVLRRCGEARRRLSLIDPATVPGLAGVDVCVKQGETIVHGDFGPQNMLVSADAGEVVAVVDWEWCHLGSAVEDLAWAEWIVRTHHPAAVPHLDEMFAGFGARPPWPERHAAMLDQCRRLGEFCRRWGAPDAVRMWAARTATTEAFRE
jgi:hypothetical protein